MIRSLYSKFILKYLVSGLMGFIAIATFSSKMIRDYLVQSKAGALYNEANNIASSCSTTYQEKRLDSKEVSTQIRALSHYLKVGIWVVNRQGIVVMDSLGGSRVQSFIDGFDPVSIGNRPYTIGGYHGTFSGDVLSVSAPITGNYDIYGCVLTRLPISEINQPRNSILNIPYIISAILFGLSLTIFLIFTQAVYLPLHKTTAGVNEYMTSNLDYRINVRTHDEIGYLSDTLDYMPDELNRMEEYRKNLMANVSHDFHPPLTSIKGYLGVILDGVILAEIYEKYLSRVMSEAEHLHELTGSTPALNSLDAKGCLSRTNFDVNRVIKDTTAFFEGICESKNVGFDLTSSDDIQMVFVDSGKIQQVMHNLIDNAIKFSHHDSTIYTQAPGRYEKIFVSVKDVGIGMPKDSLEKIWERFYKTDLSRGKGKKGTDLGLFVVRGIMQTHGKNIGVTSTEGVETEFIFSLLRSTSLQIMSARPDYPYC